MSLIESAIARARASNGAAARIAGAKPAPVLPSQASRSSTSAHALPAPAAPTAPSEQPLERIPARRLVMDLAVCRANRVLIDEAGLRNGSAVAAYRILRTRLLQRARSKQWTTIGVTSAGVSDGKSLTTLNLGLSLARERNSEVVVLDLDMRNPSLCRYLGVPAPCQLLDYFEQRAPVQDVFFSIGVDKLLFAGGTETTEAASELLGTSSFEELKEYITRHTVNPIVLIDLPPLLHTDDALVIAPRVDAMLLVVGEGRTERAALGKALELLKDCTIAGMVLNCAIETTSPYDYGYGYGLSAPRS